MLQMTEVLLGGRSGVQCDTLQRCRSFYHQHRCSSTACVSIDAARVSDACACGPPEQVASSAIVTRAAANLSLGRYVVGLRETVLRRASQEDGLQRKEYAFHDAERRLMAEVDEAIGRAVETAGSELRSLKTGTNPDDYFADAVLRRLFVRLSGGDHETNRGGDPEVAWKLLYLGRAVARYWERERGKPAVLRRKKDRPEDLETDGSEQRELARAAETFALKTAIRVLTDHASTTDPEIRERLHAAVDTYVAGLDPHSDTGRSFAEMARAHMAILSRPPEI